MAVEPKSPTPMQGRRYSKAADVCTLAICNDRWVDPGIPSGDDRLDAMKVVEGVMMFSRKSITDCVVEYPSPSFFGVSSWSMMTNGSSKNPTRFCKQVRNGGDCSARDMISRPCFRNRHRNSEMKGQRFSSVQHQDRKTGERLSALAWQAAIRSD
jgi:hypothetical protein